MEAKIRQRRLTRIPNQDPSLPRKSIITLFDAPNFPPQNPKPETAFQIQFHRCNSCSRSISHGLWALMEAELHMVESDSLGAVATTDENEDEGDNTKYQL